MKTIMILFLMLCVPAIGFAHPASNIEIDYAPTENMLTVNFVHVSSRWQKHYIRMIEVIRSSGEKQEVFYVRQEQAQNISKYISIELKPKETINVKIYCKEGGVAQSSYVVPEEEKEEKEKK